MIVAGVDGCKAGWVVCFSRGGVLQFELAATFADAVKLGPFDLVAVDMPIGFRDKAETGGRACEQALRKILGPKRGRSVFASPCRPALVAVGKDRYDEACKINRDNSIDERKGISKQSHALFPKINEIDAFLRAKNDARIYEVHPEFSFSLMVDGDEPQPLAQSKKSAAGLAARYERLKGKGIDLAPLWRQMFRLKDAGPDDVLDAAACYWTAVRLDKGGAITLPKTHPLPFDQVTKHEMSISG